MDSNIPMPGAASMDVFLKKLVQKMASDQEGIMYGKINTVEINFLNGIFVLATRNAIVPPAPTASKHASNDINTDLYNGIQKKLEE